MTSKLITHIVSLFTAAYVINWPKYMDRPLNATPSFDGRAVIYPGAKEIRDYFAWRQADSECD